MRVRFVNPAYAPQMLLSGYPTVAIEIIWQLETLKNGRLLSIQSSICSKPPVRTYN